MEVISGSIHRIVFKSEESGYAVCNIKINFKEKGMEKYKDYLTSNILTVTCYFDRIPVKDELITFTGEFMETKYGIQLKADSFKRNQEDSFDAISIYLSSEYFPKIGKVTASKIYDTLGKDCLKLIKENKAVLDKVEGLTNEQKDVIYNGLIDNNKKEKSTLSLVEMGFSMQMSKKIESILKDTELEIVFKNPYYLIDKIEGIGFLKADKIALSMGIEKNDEKRLKACILFMLSRFTYESGNCFIEKNKLEDLTFETLNKEEKIIDSESFNILLDKLEIDGDIFKENDEIFLSNVHDAEIKLANYIIDLINYNLNNNDEKEIKKALEEVKKRNNIVYSELQEKAIIEALKENIIIITGGPGTGKTTIVKGIIDTYARMYGNEAVLEEVSLLAPTGRAGKRLNEVTLHPATTIHKFLGFDGKKFKYGSNCKVDSRMIIVDEMSMVDVLLASRLFSSLPKGCKVILVGDSDQIPSVGPGEVLNDMIASKEIKTIRLNEIHRQAKESTIINLAHSVNNGYLPENILEKQYDRSFIYIDDEKILPNIKFIIKQGIDHNMDLLKDIQVLIPMYKGVLGIDNVNKELQDYFNPFDKEELVYFDKRFRINDKVIQLVNRNEDQIMNGDIGFVLSYIYNKDEITGLTIQFESKAVDYNKEELSELNLAYAISIHKSQGSEFKTVIIPFTKKYMIMLKRKLYYTAITRSKKFLIMLGDIEAFKKATDSLSNERNTKLKDLIITKANNKDKSIYDFL